MKFEAGEAAKGGLTNVAPGSVLNATHAAPPPPCEPLNEIRKEF